MGCPQKMVGVYRTQNIPVLVDEGKTAVMQEDKAEMFASTFQKAHSSDNLGINYKRWREEILKQNQDIFNKKRIVKHLWMLPLICGNLTDF